MVADRIDELTKRIAETEKSIAELDALVDRVDLEMQGCTDEQYAELLLPALGFARTTGIKKSEMLFSISLCREELNKLTGRS